MFPLAHFGRLSESTHHFSWKIIGVDPGLKHSPAPAGRCGWWGEGLKGSSLGCRTESTLPPPQNWGAGQLLRSMPPLGDSVSLTVKWRVWVTGPARTFHTQVSGSGIQCSLYQCISDYGHQFLCRKEAVFVYKTPQNRPWSETGCGGAMIFFRGWRIIWLASDGYPKETGCVWDYRTPRAERNLCTQSLLDGLKFLPFLLYLLLSDFSYKRCWCAL